MARPAVAANGEDVTAPVLKTATTVPVRYYLALPKNWNADKKWPILVCVDGSGHNFEANCRGFVAARADRPFIIITPCLTSNGNDPQDMPSLLAIVREVRKEKQGLPKFFLTGFSAGGHVTYQIVFTHPEWLAAAAPASASFTNRGIGTISTDPARVSLPVHAFQGDQDTTLKFRTEQWEAVSVLAGKNGYRSFQLTVVPGATHQPLAKQVVDFFSSLLSPGASGAGQVPSD